MTTSPWPTLCALVVIDLPKDTIGFAMAAKTQRLRGALAALQPEDRRTLMSAIALLQRLADAPPTPPNPPKRRVACSCGNPAALPHTCPRRDEFTVRCTCCAQCSGNCHWER
jgi:hypothetical protein